MMIGMTGRRRSGKDTFAEVLRVEGGFGRFAFADALKEEVSRWLGINLRELEQRKEDFRASMISRGMFGRRIKKSYWIDKVASRIKNALLTRRFVISDVRFEDEAAWIREQGGLIVRMVRIWPNGSQAVRVGVDDHESETNADTILADVTVRCASADEVRFSASLLVRALERVQV